MCHYCRRVQEKDEGWGDERGEGGQCHYCATVGQFGISSSFKISGLCTSYLTCRSSLRRKRNRLRSTLTCHAVSCGHHGPAGHLTGVSACRSASAEAFRQADLQAHNPLIDKHTFSA